MITEEHKARIKELNDRITACPACPFMFEGRVGRKELTDVRGTEVLFISDYPNAKGNGRIQDLNLSQTLKSYCTKAEIDWEKTSLSYFCKVEIPPTESIRAQDKKHCLGHVLEEIVTLRPDMIITLGTLSKEFFDMTFNRCIIGEFNVMGKDREVGRILETLSIPVLALYNPFAVAYGNVDKDVYITNLKKAYYVGQREHRKLAEPGSSQSEVHQEAEGGREAGGSTQGDEV